MPHLTGAEALIRSIRAYGVDTIFGLPGGQTYHLFDAIVRDDHPIRVINSRHEQGVAYMAYGYARSTGRVGVYTVVPGPGVLNTTAALCTAYACNAPVLCLAGQIPSANIGKGIGFLHEIPDQLGILQRLTKWATRIDHPGDAPAAVREAFRQLLTGKVQPVALEMAPDIMGMEADVQLLEAVTDYAVTEPDPDAVAGAARLLANARKPLIVVGSGATHAGEELLLLAEHLQAPVTTLWSGKGIVDERHYLSQPYPNGHALWADADVVLAVGTRLKFPQLYWGLDDALKIVRIDIDPATLDRIAKPAVGIVADAKAALRHLLPAVQSVGPAHASRKQECLALKASLEEDLRRNLAPQFEMLKVIREELPEDGYFVDEVTQVGYASWYALPMYEPRHFVTSGYQGNLGYGYATAVGVQAAHPDKSVVVVGGDGGFLYTGQEIATAVNYGLNVVAIVFNNNAYGNVQRAQREEFGGRVIASDLRNPDFVKFSESFGAAGYRAHTPEQLRDALRDALRQAVPSVIEVPMGDVPSPWPYIMLPQVRPKA